MKLLIWGIGGRLGRTLLEDAKNKEYISLIAGYDKFAQFDEINSTKVYHSVEEIDEKFDYIIDFSKPDSINCLMNYAVKNNTPVVIATTGHNCEQMNIITNASNKIAIFKSTNMSIGVNLIIELAKQACKALGETFDIEIVEAHHNIKVDSPSGTALTIAEEINKVYNNDKNFVYGRHSANQRRDIKDIGIHSVRGGSVIGKHDIMFLGNDEFITVSHQAQSKSIFTQGALRAAEFIKDKKPGLYSMSDLLK